MNYKTGVEPISALKAHTAEILQRAREAGQPILITQNGKPAAILQDVESYQKQRDQLLMLKLVLQGEHDYRQGKVVSHGKAKNSLKKKIEGIANRAEAI